MNSTAYPPQKPDKRAPKSRRLPWIIAGLVVLIVTGFVITRFFPNASSAELVRLPEVKQRASTDPANSEGDKALTEPNLADLSVPELAELPLEQRVSQAAIDAAEHPFDPLLKVALTCLNTIDNEVQDYQATLSSQVRIDGELLPPKKLLCKIRHASDDPDDRSPFSVYTRFLEPKDNAGQEAIWVEGWNEGNLVAHLTGFANLKRFYLKPTSSHAMDGNRYPIYEIGVRNLLVKMTETARHDREFGECEVKIQKGLEIDGRACTMLEVKHPTPREHFDFHLARIYIDNELEIPLAYEGYLWPETEGGPPLLLEKYYYTDIQINQGFKDIDFDPANEDYEFPGW